MKIRLKNLAYLNDPLIIIVNKLIYPYLCAHKVVRLGVTCSHNTDYTHYFIDYIKDILLVYLFHFLRTHKCDLIFWILSQITLDLIIFGFVLVWNHKIQDKYVFMIGKALICNG